MKKVIIAILGLSILLQAQGLDNRTREHLKKDHQTVSGLVQLVHAKGYRCSSVVALIPFIFGGGYTLSCDAYSYQYDIEKLDETYDRNSPQWEVTVH